MGFTQPGTEPPAGLLCPARFVLCPPRLHRQAPGPGLHPYHSGLPDCAGGLWACGPDPHWTQGHLDGDAVKITWAKTMPSHSDALMARKRPRWPSARCAPSGIHSALCCRLPATDPGREAGAAPCPGHPPGTGLFLFSCHFYASCFFPW